MRDDLIQPVWDTAIMPAMVMLPPRFSAPRAWHMLIAIGLQESKLRDRVQRVNGGGVGPARGLWQFERGGGVRGVLQHDASRELARQVCSLRSVRPDAQAVWENLELDDALACAFARLLLWTDPKPLPGPDDVDTAWDLYARVWRPGKPHPSTWPMHHARARRFVYGE